MELRPGRAPGAVVIAGIRDLEIRLGDMHFREAPAIIGRNDRIDPALAIEDEASELLRGVRALGWRDEGTRGEARLHGRDRILTTDHADRLLDPVTRDALCGELRNEGLARQDVDADLARTAFTRTAAPFGDGGDVLGDNAHFDRIEGFRRRL